LPKKIYFISASIYFIEADRLRLNQVLDNVFNNAIKFIKARAHDCETNNENTITIILQRNIKDKDKGKDYDDSTNYNSEAIISVKDTGIGIDPEIFPRLFTKFATKSDKGTGLGLFICKSIVEAHGGTMWAENNTKNNGATNENQGAIFYFTVPISNHA
jgi:signal transduction histidine kinase